MAFRKRNIKTAGLAVTSLALVGLVGVLTGGVSAAFAFFVNNTFPTKVLEQTDGGSTADHFGYSVAASGDDVLVGSHADDNGSVDQGSAYVFTRGSGDWSQGQKLTASDAQGGDQFGAAVAIDGDTLVVGAPAVGGGTVPNVGDWGAAYVFERSAGTWVETQKLTAAGLTVGALMGSRVAISGDYIALGTFHNASATGTVYIFQRNAAGAGLWGQVAVIWAPAPVAGGQFGTGLSLSGDLLLVGALGHQQAYVYDRTANWAHAATLTGGTGEYFGLSAAISGNTAIVSALIAPNPAGSINQTGAAYIFGRAADGSWSLTKQIFASEGSDQDQFGNWVAIAGDIAVVGAFADDPYGAESGAAYAFSRDEGGANNWGETNKLVPDPGGPDHWFGWGVSTTPSRAVVGAPFNNGNTNYPPKTNGFVYIFDLAVPTPTPTPTPEVLKSDILWRNDTTGENYVWYQDGVTTTAGAYLDPVANLSWKIVGTGDFNGDGKPDIVWRSSTTGDNYVWYQDGVTTTAGAYLDPVANLSWKIVGIEDFNGDGKPDILWRNSTTGDNYVWYQDGVTTTAGSYLDAVANLSWEIVGTGDFNGDGKPDILWRNDTTGENYVWYQDGVTTTAGSYLDAVANLSWEIVGTGDFNGDGKPDILWRNDTTGENYVWYQDGVMTTGGAYVDTVANLSWKIVGTLTR